MAQLTQKELMLIQDNIKMCQDSTKFIQGCINIVNDPELKNLCQQMIQEHNQDVQTLTSHITQSNVQ